MNVALSRARGKDNIRLLRNFDAKPLTTHPNEREVAGLRLVGIDSEKESIGASHQIQECLVSQLVPSTKTKHKQIPHNFLSINLKANSEAAHKMIEIGMR